MPSRKSSKNSHDNYGRAYANGGYNYGPPQYGSYNRYVNSSGININHNLILYNLFSLKLFRNVSYT